MHELHTVGLPMQEGTSKEEEFVGLVDLVPRDNGRLLATIAFNTPRKNRQEVNFVNALAGTIGSNIYKESEFLDPRDHDWLVDRLLTGEGFVIFETSGLEDWNSIFQLENGELSEEAKTRLAGFGFIRYLPGALQDHGVTRDILEICSIWGNNPKYQDGTKAGEEAFRQAAKLATNRVKNRVKSGFYGKNVEVMSSLHERSRKSMENAIGADKVVPLDPESKVEEYAHFVDDKHLSYRILPAN